MRLSDCLRKGLEVAAAKAAAAAAAADGVGGLEIQVDEGEGTE